MVGNGVGGAPGRDPYRPLKEEFSGFLRNLGPGPADTGRRDWAAAAAAAAPDPDVTTTEAWASSLLFGMSQARGVYSHHL